MEQVFADESELDFIRFDPTLSVSNFRLLIRLNP